MLFAVAIQLAADVVFAANSAARYLHELPHLEGVNDLYSRWLAPKLIAYIERDVGATLIGLGFAVSVEVTFRVWERLRTGRPTEAGAH